MAKLPLSPPPAVRQPDQVRRNPFLDRAPDDVQLCALFEELAQAQAQCEGAAANLAGDTPARLARGVPAPSGVRPGHQSRALGAAEARQRVLDLMERVGHALRAAKKTWTGARTLFINHLKNGFGGVAGGADAIACRTQWIDAAKKLYDASGSTTKQLSMDGTAHVPSNPWLAKSK